MSGVWQDTNGYKEPQTNKPSNTNRVTKKTTKSHEPRILDTVLNAPISFHVLFSPLLARRGSSIENTSDVSKVHKTKDEINFLNLRCLYYQEPNLEDSSQKSCCF